ncbi:MAG: ATP-binding protein [Candidatus Dormibacteraeota bacterium]|nr:ATP-binding protein [Candidatus Dormibacteraeota bacterium]
MIGRDAEGVMNPRKIGALFSYISDAVAVLDGSWRIRRWNPAGERSFGYAEDRLVGQPFASLFADADAFARTRAELEEVEQAAGAVRSQLGRVIPVRCRTIPLDGGGGLADWRAILIQEQPNPQLDETGQALIRQLHQLAETTAAIVAEADVLAVAQSLTDLAKVLVAADFSALVLVEPDRDTFRATGFTYNAPRELFPLDRTHPDLVGILGRPLQTRSIVRIADVRQFPGAVGIPVHHPPVEAFLGVPLFSKGNVVGELLVANRVDRPAFTDLEEALLAQLGTIAGALLETARLRLEAGEHAAEMDQINTRRRAAMASIAHDLRTPVAAVRGFAELAADPRLPEAKRLTMLRRLETQAQLLIRLIDDLNTAARIDMANFAVQVEPVDVAQLLEEVQSEYRLRFSKRRFDATGAGPALALADRQRLRQVLTNLIDNAIKYSSDTAAVSSQIDVTADEVLVTVVDHGHGIPAGDLPRIFDPFYRSQSAGSVTGMGLGLTIVRGLMRAMGGEVTVPSTDSSGSRFRLCLRRVRA